MKRERQPKANTRPTDRDHYSDPIGNTGPPHLLLTEETVTVRDFTVSVCRMSKYLAANGEHADFRLVAVAGDHWYQVDRWSDLERACKAAALLERPCERTHRLSLIHGTRIASLTPELYKLTGKATFSTSYLKVHWAPPGSAFHAGAEYDSPLDARYPRWVTQEDLDADADRRVAIYPFWQPRMADAYDLSADVYSLGDGEELVPRR